MCSQCPDHVVNCDECTDGLHSYKGFYLMDDPCEHLVLKYGTESIIDIRDIIWYGEDYD